MVGMRLIRLPIPDGQRQKLRATGNGPVLTAVSTGQRNPFQPVVNGGYGHANERTG